MDCPGREEILYLSGCWCVSCPAERICANHSVEEFFFSVRRRRHERRFSQEMILRDPLSASVCDEVTTNAITQETHQQPKPSLGSRPGQSIPTRCATESRGDRHRGFSPMTGDRPRKHTFEERLAHHDSDREPRRRRIEALARCAPTGRGSAVRREETAVE